MLATTTASFLFESLYLTNAFFIFSEKKFQTFVSVRLLPELVNNIVLSEVLLAFIQMELRSLKYKSNILCVQD